MIDQTERADNIETHELLDLYPEISDELSPGFAEAKRRSVELGKLGALIDGHADEVEVQQLTVTYEGGAIIARDPATGEALGGRLRPGETANIAEIHQWLVDKARWWFA
jgi:hypothetical protein